MQLRPETPQDYGKIFNFVQTAFATAHIKDGTEQDYVNMLRQSPNYLPNLTLMGELDGELTAYIMFTKTYVKNGDNMYEALLLAPVAVAIEHRNRGLGSDMIKTALEMAKDDGHQAVFVVGDYNYYQRFGFKPISTFGLTCDLPVQADMLDNVMALELQPGALDDVAGVWLVPAPESLS